MKPINVIRIEHPYDKKGLFRAEDEQHNYRIHKHSRWGLILNRHTKPRFPTFWFDDELRIKLYELNSYYHRFAYNSVEQFKKALTKAELDECVYKLGFRVYRITPRDYYQSIHQTVFNKDNVIKKVDITEELLENNKK